MKIAIIGTHGTGKTTLSYALASHYKLKGKNVKIIQEVVRSCPFPINEKMSSESALWIYHKQSIKELEASLKSDIVICDRSILDPFVYANHFGLMSQEVARLQKVVLERFVSTYDKIIWVRPDTSIISDGVRSCDLSFQHYIDLGFAGKLEGIPHTMINSSDIFKKDDICSICF